MTGQVVRKQAGGGEVTDVPQVLHARPSPGPQSGVGACCPLAGRKVCMAWPHLPTVFLQMKLNLDGIRNLIIV